MQGSREVDAKTIEQSLGDDHWPADLQWLRAEFWSKNATGTPVFALIRGNKRLAHYFGSNNWESKMLPSIKKQAGTS